jgi:hypothetical protein
VFVQLEVPRAHGGAIQLEEPPAFEDAVDDRLGEVRIVKHPAPVLEGLVGCEEHRALAQVAFVDDVEQDVGGVGPVGQVAELVDHEHRRARVRREQLGEPALARGDGELLHQRGGRREEGLEAVLDGAVGDRDGEVRLAPACLAGEDKAAPVGDEVWREIGPEHRQAQGRLVGEVELVDGLEERKAGPPGQALHARLLPMGDFLGQQDREEITIGPLFLFGARGQVAVDAGGVGQVQALAERFDRDRRHGTGGAAVDRRARHVATCRRG